MTRRTVLVEDQERPLVWIEPAGPMAGPTIRPRGPGSFRVDPPRRGRESLECLAFVVLFVGILVLVPLLFGTPPTP